MTEGTFHEAYGYCSVAADLREFSVHQGIAAVREVLATEGHVPILGNARRQLAEEADALLVACGGCDREGKFNSGQAECPTRQAAGTLMADNNVADRLRPARQKLKDVLEGHSAGSTEENDPAILDKLCSWGVASQEKMALLRDQVRRGHKNYDIHPPSAEEERRGIEAENDMDRLNAVLRSCGSCILGRVKPQAQGSVCPKAAELAETWRSINID